jgi:hypothetical protein
MYICENCGQEHNGTYASGRFCSSKCSKGFSTKAKRKEINEKVSKKIIEKLLNGERIGRCKINFNNYEIEPIQKTLVEKEKFCISCNEKIEKINNKKLCSQCKEFYQYKKLFGKLNIYDSNVKIANDKVLKLLKDEYFINKLSSCDIQQKYKIQLNTLHFYFKKNGIHLRTNTEANVLCYENGKLSPQSSNCYVHGWYTTWDKKQVYLRSSYEFNYAKELDDYKILYEVESKRIKYYDTIKKRERIAVPDFYLSNLNMIVEIKSNYTLDLQNMKDKFKQYNEEGYKTKLI